MALRTTLKCSTCKSDTPRDDVTKHGGKNYCPTCWEEKQKPTEDTDWDILFRYICELYRIDRPTGMMFKQLKEFRQDYGYTDIGIYHTLRYYYEVLGNEVLEGTGLGIVAYYYDRARRHIMQVYDVSEAVESFKPDERVIHRSVQQATSWKVRKPISLSKVEWGEEDED